MSICRHANLYYIIKMELCKISQIIVLSIGGFNQRIGEALPPQIFLMLKFVVCIALKIIEIVAT